MLADLEEYIGYGLNLGSKSYNKYSKKYVKGLRPSDGIKIIDINQIDEKIQILINLLVKTNEKNILIVGKRYNAQKGLKLFSKLTGIKTNTTRYLPGKLSNTILEDFSEYKLIIVCDPLFDKNILNEAFSSGVFISALCDTNNTSNKIDLVVPINNKNKKSMGMFFYLLTKNYMIQKKIIAEKDFKYSPEDFCLEDDE